MHPKHFGESHDMEKMQTMQWLAPKAPWTVHMMWFNQGPAVLPYHNFPQEYQAALRVKHL